MLFVIILQVDIKVHVHHFSLFFILRIDHWDHEKERIVLITKKSLCLVKYNFIGLKVEEMRKIPLTKCDKIQVGRFVYPKNTMMM